MVIYVTFFGRGFWDLPVLPLWTRIVRQHAVRKSMQTSSVVLAGTPFSCPLYCFWEISNCGLFELEADCLVACLVGVIEHDMIFSVLVGCPSRILLGKTTINIITNFPGHRSPPFVHSNIPILVVREGVSIVCAAGDFVIVVSVVHVLFEPSSISHTLFRRDPSTTSVSTRRYSVLRHGYKVSLLWLVCVPTLLHFKAIRFEYSVLHCRHVTTTTSHHTHCSYSSPFT